MENTRKIGITSNILKVIVIIIMIIDHIGMYMSSKFTYDTYYILRSIGRIAMPVFAYLLVQGFFYTKDLKRFIFRIFGVAVITQILLFIMGFVDEVKYYNKPVIVHKNLNILFSYTLSLLLITAIDRKKIIKKLSEEKNIFIRINILVLAVIAYLQLDIEYGLRIPFIILEMYAIEKLFMDKGNKLIHTRDFKNATEKIRYKTIYLITILIALWASLIFIEDTTKCKYAMLASIPIIALYNGNRGNKNKMIQYGFYAIYPLQHLIIYILSIQ